MRRSSQQSAISAQLGLALLIGAVGLRGQTAAPAPLTVKVVVIQPAGSAAVATNQLFPSNVGLAATGGTSPYTWAVTAGSLPPGIALTSQGVFSGTSTAAGTFSFSITATDSGMTAQQSATVALSVTFPNPPLVILTNSCAPAVIKSLYTGCQMKAGGGVPPYTWSISAGALPAGLTLNATTGLISGTPTLGGSSNFTVQVKDSSLPTAKAFWKVGGNVARLRGGTPRGTTMRGEIRTRYAQ